MKDLMSNGNAKWITYANPNLTDNIVNNDPWKNKNFFETQFKAIEDKEGLALFRKIFNVSEIKKADIKATSMGIFELYCNGKRVGRKDETGNEIYDEMKPGWTAYQKRVLYYTYDLLPYLKEGENCILAAVAPGWYNGRISFGTYGDTHIAFMCEIDIEDKDGSNKIYTDKTWKAMWGGAVRAADIWDGELYDGNKPTFSELSIGSDEENWSDPVEESRDINITKHIGPTINIRNGLTRKPKTTTIYNKIIDNDTDFGKINVVRFFENSDKLTLKSGETAVIDLKQEIVGRPKFKVKGKKGTEVKIRVGEMLNDSGLKSRGNDGPEGSIYSINYRSAKAKAYYILNDNADFQYYCPMFTFFGFRYFEISATNDVEFEEIACDVIGSDVKETGKMVTSSEDVNKLISNIIWGQRGNYFSVPTDCPQRDERLGWTGDTQAFCRTAAYNGNVDGFFHKWLQDARDSQSEEGMYPDVIPNVRVVGWGGAAWADAGIIVPYTMWKMYADTEIIKEHYDSMEKYMDWIASREFEGPQARYGDWLAYEPTDKSYICLAYYALDCKYMEAMANAIGKTDRAEHFAKLYEEIRNVFRSKYMDENRDLKPEHRTQTGYLLALRNGFYDDDKIEGVIKALKQKIIDNNYKLSTGFVGSCILNEILAEFGENNLAYSLLLQTGDPSWLYSVHQGATTVWERWNSYTKARGFGDVHMNSFNHYAYGAVQEWMYRHVAGIEPAEPGFKKLILAPEPDTRTESEMPENQERITFVNTSFESPEGLIVSNWKYEKTFTYEAEVPVETILYLPVLTKEDTFLMNDETKKFADYTKSKDGKTIEIKLSAGKYVFKEN